MSGKSYYNVQLGANPNYQPNGPSRDAWNKMKFSEKMPFMTAWKLKNKAFQEWAKETGFQRDHATEVKAETAIAKAQKQFPEFVFKSVEQSPIGFFSI